MKLKFSVIVPIYKVEAYLQKCVDSILTQTYPDFELILVDDGSPDCCPAICDRYAEQDERVRVIHKENGGLVSARIAGAKEAQGEYVCCVDGDDWVHPLYLKKFYDAISSTGAEIVCCGCFKAFANESENVPKALPYRFGYYDKEAIKESFFPKLIQDVNNAYFTPNVWSKAFKKELYLPEQLEVNPKIKIGEDIACTTGCVYHADSIYVLPDCLYYYRQNETAMTKERKPFDWNGPRLIAEHQNKRIDLKAFDFQEQVYRSIVHLLFNVVVSQFYRKESYWVIVKDIKRHLQDEMYVEAIQKCKFKSKKGRLAAFSLKYRLYGLMWLYSRCK